MSPTSYQTAPPRDLMITTAPWSVKRGAQIVLPQFENARSTPADFKVRHYRANERLASAKKPMELALAAKGNIRTSPCEKERLPRKVGSNLFQTNLAPHPLNSAMGGAAIAKQKGFQQIGSLAEQDSLPLLLQLRAFARVHDL